MRPRAAPDADDQEHRDQAGLEEQVEQHEIERREHADHQRFQHQEGDHVFLARASRSTSQLARMQIGIRKVVSITNSIEMPSTPILIADARRRASACCSTNWKPRSRRDRSSTQISSDSDEGDQRGPQRDPARRCAGRLRRRRAAIRMNSDADQRQEGDDGENGPAGHQCAPREHEPGDRAATPISMAKA